ncbi:MAG: YpdA family putative bacillithiol disulfide reductase [Acidobacteria bacterium]|nr:YpdA family putative bacillithiol disulfide reductase [Acidobacteriota bacterium]MBI3658414.1 YpdA family putative bacillithiol disulfide reductase [Acidobacteriota bacterium]
METRLDVIVVGAGPTGLACAIAAKRAGLTCLVLEKGCLVNSLANFPRDMVFFTTSELLEIGGIPMTSLGYKPTRGEALKYYRAVAQAFQLRVNLYEKVESITRVDGDFHVRTQRRTRQSCGYRTRTIVLATGYYDQANRLGIPGEDLDKVFHYYTEGHRYYNMDVAVIGGKNSAAESALDLFRSGARVTLIHRGPEISAAVKYWIKPDIENRIKAGQIAAYFNAQVIEIQPTTVGLATPEGVRRLANDFVFAMIGYHPDTQFFESLGIEIQPLTKQPTHNPKTLESNVAGIYLAGVVLAGMKSNEIFIENGRFHGTVVMETIAQALSAPSASP